MVEQNQVQPPHFHRTEEPAPDLSVRRFALREILDGPCTFADYRHAALRLERLNRITRAYRPAQDLLARVLARRGVSYEPLHIVDIGCGHGDHLRALHRWAGKRSVPLRLTGIDLNPYAARLAIERDRHEHIAAGTVRWITGSAFETTPPQPADIVLCSLVAHHLPDEEIVRLLAWCGANARIGWQITDLIRSERAMKVFPWIARLLSLGQIIAHDGVASFQRALSLTEWHQLVAMHMPSATVIAAPLSHVRIEYLSA